MPDIDFYTADNYDPSQSLGFTLRQIVVSMTRAIDQRMAEHGITDAQWKPLLHISMGRASTAAELAREGCIDTGAITRLLDRLEAKGLVLRVRSTEDRRVVKLELTPEGERLAALIPRALCEVINGHLAGFSREEHDVLRALLLRMLENGQRMNANAPRGEEEDA
ncbi:MarR family winged helix-turn-helix transcriptional regulator [Derxia lacustris]|uniref:MarR family winged helix-turn-helix transcriptional regulator n=1 Tax=Derxia lacustris TaxID=764842 RepID=UPI000A17190B|nr:MarR family transcriptional regulator [Derxia lacustris]